MSPDALGTNTVVVGGNTAVTGDVVIEYTACFLQGTRLAGPAGPVPIEALRVGDLLFSHLRSFAVPVTWIGRRRMDCDWHPERVLPVRIRAHAFGRGRPVCDLRLSPDHAVFHAGVLIPVPALVNGRSVAQEAADAVTYWHIEIDMHDVLLAEGLPVESYLDAGTRAAFLGGLVTALHPDFAARVWEAQACAPLKLVGPDVDTARRLLDQRGRFRLRRRAA